VEETMTAPTVNDLLAKFDGLIEEDKRIQQELMSTLNEVQARIRSGETTGNAIDDFVIVTNGGINPDAAKLYRELELSFAQNKGGLFLAVEKWESSDGCCGLGPSTHSRDFHWILETAFFLGVISGERLIFDFENQRCDFPLGMQVRFKDSLAKGVDVKVLDKQLTHQLHCGRFEDHLRQPLKCENPLNRFAEHLQLEFFFGDLAVESYFSILNRQTKQLQSHFALARQLLGK